MLSSLKQVDKKTIKKTMNEFGVDSVKELSKYLIEEFEDILHSCTDDIGTRVFFKNLVENENSDIFSVYEQDVENFNVFVYKKR